MRSTKPFKFLVLLTGAALSAGAASARVPGGGVRPVEALQAVRAAQEEQAGEQQDPEQFEIATRERIGEDGQRVRVGNTQFILNSIFEFTDTANDLFVWGWLPTISGDISDNAFIGGQKVDIGPDAIIGGDLFLFAQTSRIDGFVGGDLYTFTAELSIAESARIDGAIHGSAAALTIDGEVGGPISLAGGAVTLNGRVRGDVRVEAGELVLGPAAVIEGELRYESPREADIDPAARVEGDINYFEPQEDEEDGAESPSSGPSGRFSLWNLLWDGWWLISSFLVGALALAVGGDRARKPAACLGRQPALGLGFGFVVAVVFPAAAMHALILVVTIPMGLIGLALYVAAIYLARLVAAHTVGDWLLRAVRGGTEPSAYASLALGLVLFYVLTQIPYVGFLVWLAAVVGGLGGIFLATRRPKGPADPNPAVVPAPVS